MADADKKVMKITADTSGFESSLKSGERSVKRFLYSTENYLKLRDRSMNRFLDSIKRRAESLSRIKAEPRLSLIDQISSPLDRIEMRLKQLTRQPHVITVSVRNMESVLANAADKVKKAGTDAVVNTEGAGNTAGASPATSEYNRNPLADNKAFETTKKAISIGDFGAEILGESIEQTLNPTKALLIPEPRPEDSLMRGASQRTIDKLKTVQGVAKKVRGPLNAAEWAMDAAKIATSDDPVKTGLAVAAGRAPGMIASAAGTAIGGPVLGALLGGGVDMIVGDFVEKKVEKALSTAPNLTEAIVGKFNQFKTSIGSIFNSSNNNTAIPDNNNTFLQTATTEIIAIMSAWGEQLWSLTAISAAFAANLQNVANIIITNGNALATALANASANPIQVPATPNEGEPHAVGGLFDKPHLGLVGEAGPEAVIPLSSRMRSRALGLFQQVGEYLGVRQYASGGFVGAMPAIAGAGAGGGNINVSVESIPVNFINGDSDEEALAARIGALIVGEIKKAVENR